MRSLLPWMVLLAAAAGCEMFAYADRDLIPKGSGGSGGHESGAACIYAFDCPGADGPCSARDCLHGRCVEVLEAEGTPTGHQIAGDCHKEVCDGAGNVEVVVDPSNVLDDDDPCTVDTCYFGVPVNSPGPADVPCTFEGGPGVCDTSGRCVGCILAGQCGALSCVDNRCVPSTCNDGVKDGQETSVDCGGPECAPCVDGDDCKLPRDCASGVCSGSPAVCQVPSCTDGIQNGDETGVDCGGSCRGCPAGEGCAASADCESDLCSGSVCLPTCSDGVRDGAETGDDCGGYACKPCAVGFACVYDSDCTEHVCRGGVCLPPTCIDGKQDGTETGVDCGGGCLPCGPGMGCAVGGDCTSHVCAGSICSTPSCSDGVQNGQETGVDCGGPVCPPCPTGQGCDVAADCAGGLCTDGICAQPSCTDGIQDGTETGVDCGGSCPGCPPGQPCKVDGDCQSLVCTSGVCAG